MMLAQSFKTATNLGLTERQHAALVTTLGLLERDEVTYSTPLRLSEREARRENFTGHFNMVHWNAGSPGCETVCCIGGTAELVGGLEAGELWNACDDNQRLYRLFFPNGDLSQITVEQAATALRNYLTHGRSQWNLVLSDTD